MGSAAEGSDDEVVVVVREVVVGRECRVATILVGCARMCSGRWCCRVG